MIKASFMFQTRTPHLAANRDLRVRAVWIAALSFSCALVACHADADDPAGQASELRDPIRRQNAISNLSRLYAKALAEHEGDRSSEAVKKIADAIYAPMNDVYLDAPQDIQNGQSILDLMAEMQDARTIPSLVQALRFRTGVSEAHATRAAQALRSIQIPEAERSKVIEALAAALDRVRGSTGQANRLRIALIRSLRAMRDSATAASLTKMAMAQREDQDFQINRMAAVALGELGLAESADSMIRGLYLFGLGQPNMRMNDVAAEALVRIGRPSLGPLLRTLDGQNQDANDLAEAYIAAVRAVNPRAAAQTSVRQHVSSEAAFALGALGLPEAFPPLLAETESGDSARALQACIAMVRLLLPDAEREALREVLVSVYEALPDHVSGAAKRVQLLTVMKHTYDPKMLPFFQKEMNDRAQIPDVRIAAASAYATLANKEELRPIRRYVSQEQNPRDGRHDPMLDAAEECDVALRCWQEKLRSSDPVLASKASFMLGRLGRDNAAVISSLVSKLGDSSPEIRLAALAALDRVAVHGSQEAIDKIEELRVAEQGRSVWNVFGREALPVQARLRLRLES